jgi:hypothetical protein
MGTYLYLRIPPHKQKCNYPQRNTSQRSTSHNITEQHGTARHSTAQQSATTQGALTFFWHRQVFLHSPCITTGAIANSHFASLVEAN